jgi:hypothetical protein
MLAAILGGLAASVAVFAMVAEIYQVTEIRRGYDHLPAGNELFDRAFAYLVTAVLAVCAPLYAAIGAPRRFSLSVLTGWVGGAAAIAVSTNSYVQQMVGLGPEPPFFFGFALLLLAMATGVALLPGAPAPRPHPPISSPHLPCMAADFAHSCWPAWPWCRC